MVKVQYRLNGGFLMENKNKVVLVVVIMSFLLNIVMYNSLSNIRNEIQNVRNSNSSYIQTLESRLNNLT